MRKYILILFLCSNCFGQPVDWVEVEGMWELVETKNNYHRYYNIKLKTSKWAGFPDPNYSWDGDRLSYEREVTDEDGKKRTIKTYKKPFEITANFKPEIKVSLASPGISRAVRERFGGGLKGFVWLDNISGSGQVTLPFIAPHIFIAKGDRLNPVLTEISTDTSADNWYEIFDGKTYVYVKSFSGIGGAAGAPPTLIAHYKMNENTASDNDERVTNGNFATWTVPGTPTGWTVSGESGNDPEVDEAATGESHANTPTLGGGMCNIYTSNGTLISIQRNVTVVVGRKYRFSIVVDTRVAGGIRIVEGAATMWPTVAYTSAGTYTFTFVATGTTVTLRIVRNAIEATDVTFDDVSVKLCAVEDSSGNDHDGLLQEDTDAAHVDGKINGAFDFDGSSDYIKIGDTASDVKSIVMWVNPDSVTAHTDYPIDLNGTDYITIVNGTVTKNGFATGTQIIYVDGKVASTVTANWHLIGLTSTVGFTADDLDIGREGSNYFDGLIDNVVFFSIELTPDEVKRLYNNRNGTEILQEIDSVIRPRRSNTSPLGTRARFEFP